MIPIHPPFLFPPHTHPISSPLCTALETLSTAVQTSRKEDLTVISYYLNEMKSLWLACVSYCIPLCLPGGCRQAAVYIRCDLYLIDFSICQLVRHPFLLSVFYSPFCLSYLVLISPSSP